MIWSESISADGFGTMESDAPEGNPTGFDTPQPDVSYVDPPRAGFFVAPRKRTVSKKAFNCFMLLTGVLFLGPGDIFPALNGMPVYLVTLIAALVLLRKRVFAQLSWRSLKMHPITLCVLGVMGSAVLSQIVNGDRAAALGYGEECMKFVPFYLLMVAAIDTPKRLRAFLTYLSVFAFIVCTLGLLNFYGVVNVNASPYLETQEYRNLITGEDVVLARLVSVGIFNNPNDVARIAMVGILACLYCAGLRRGLTWKGRWYAMIAVQIWAMVLTYSRGGFLGLLAGAGMLGAIRYGRTKAIMACVVVVPVLLLMSSGRFNFDTSSGTGQERILLWRDAFEEMKTSPIFGIGIGEFGGDEGLVAHNSFMQCFTEMGILGGTVYTGAFYMALWGLWRIKSQFIPDGEQRRERVFVLAILAAAVMGMMSSTRILRVDTYMLLALAAISLGFSAQYAPELALRVNMKLAKRLVIVSLITLIMFNLYVRLEAH